MDDAAYFKRESPPDVVCFSTTGSLKVCPMIDLGNPILSKERKIATSSEMTYPKQIVSAVRSYEANNKGNN